MRRILTPTAVHGPHPYEHRPAGDASELSAALAMARPDDVVLATAAAWGALLEQARRRVTVGVDCPGCGGFTSLRVAPDQAEALQAVLDEEHAECPKDAP